MRLFLSELLKVPKNLKYGLEFDFSEFSLFSEHFLNEDFFGSDFSTEFINIDKLLEQLTDRWKKFLKKYYSEFIQSEDEN